MCAKGRYGGYPAGNSQSRYAGICHAALLLWDVRTAENSDRQVLCHKRKPPEEENEIRAYFGSMER